MACAPTPAQTTLASVARRSRRCQPVRLPFAVRVALAAASVAVAATQATTEEAKNVTLPETTVLPSTMELVAPLANTSATPTEATTEEAPETTVLPSTTEVVAPLATTSAAPAEVKGAKIVSGSDSGSDTVVLAISLSIAGLVVIVAVAAGLRVLVAWRRSTVAKQLRDIEALETRESDYEVVRRKLANRMDIYMESVAEFVAQGRELSGAVREKHDAYLGSWRKFCEDHSAFVEGEFLPALNRRRAAVAAEATRKLEKEARRSKVSAASKAKGSSSSTSSTTGLATQFGSPAAAPPPPQPPGGGGLVRGDSASNFMRARRISEVEGQLWPSPPATPPKEVQRQLQKLDELSKRLAVLCDTFQRVWDEALPEGVGVAAPPPIAVLNPTIEHSDYGSPMMDEQAKLFAPLAHPLLQRVKVRPYGVLGTREGEADPRPGATIDAVVVDPAGWSHVGPNNSAKFAGGASGSLYQWLELKKSGGRFPPEVNRHFDTPFEQDAEKRAKFHAYGEGKYVIHAVGPKLRELMDGFRDLSATYCNVLFEFCEAVGSAGGGGGSSTSRGVAAAPPAGVSPGASPADNASRTQVPRTLRLLPISSGIFLQNKRLEKHMAEVTWSALCVAFMMLPTSLQDILKDSCIEVCLFQRKDFSSYEAALGKKQALVSGDSMTLNNDLGRVAQRRGGYDWVRTANGPEDRMQRLGAALQTSQAISSGGYTLPGNKAVRFTALRQLLDGTKPRLAGTAPFKHASNQVRTTKVVRDELAFTVMEAAMRCQQAGKRTVAVNAASAYSVGGGVLHGGRHALEETWCTMSTLLPALQKMQLEHWRLQVADQHIPVDGCIISPSVEIFRETSAHGYGFQASTTRLQGVCSVAMFNMNERVSDSPLDAPRDFGDYCRQVKKKFLAVVAGAADLDGEVLVVPDVGCGVFANDPKTVGSLLGEAILELNGLLAEVVLVGKPGFCEAAKQAFAGTKAQRRPYGNYFETEDGHPISVQQSTTSDFVAIASVPAEQANSTNSGRAPMNDTRSDPIVYRPPASSSVTGGRGSNLRAQDARANG